MRAVQLLLGAFVLVGCVQHGGRLLVVVDTDIAVPTDMAQIYVEVRVGAADRATASSFFPLEARGVDAGRGDVGAGGPVAPPFSFVVTAPNPPAAAEITAIGFRDAASLCTPLDMPPGCTPEIVRQRIRTNFIPNSTALVRMFLANRCRTGMPPTGCAFGACDVADCVPDTVVAETLPATFMEGAELFDAPRSDAGVAGDAPTATRGESAILRLPDGAAEDRAGRALSLDETGTLAVVGAPDARAMTGRADVWRRSATAWAREAELVPSVPSPGGRFGSAVSVAASDGRVIVGAPFDQLQSEGRAFVFGPAPWMQEHEVGPLGMVGMGASVGLGRDGAIAVVGTPGRTMSRGGAAVLERPASMWGAPMPLMGPGTLEPGDAVGRSGALSADGRRLILGGQDSAYLFDLDVDTAIDIPTPVGAVDFGAHVAISAESECFVVSARGGAYVYSEAVSIDPERVDSGDATPAVAMSADGRRVLVASPDVGLDGRTGYVTVFDVGTALRRVQVLRPTIEQDGDSFGESVAISGDGRWALVGAPTDDIVGPDAGAVYVFSLGP